MTITTPKILSFPQETGPVTGNPSPTDQNILTLDGPSAANTSVATTTSSLTPLSFPSASKETRVSSVMNCESSGEESRRRSKVVCPENTSSGGRESRGEEGGSCRHHHHQYHQ